MTEHTLSEAEYDAITDAAAHWCMRLHAVDCTDAERQAFQQWHDADPLHAFEYEAMLEIWEVADHLPRVEPAAPAPASRLRSRWSRLAVAAAMLVVGLPVAAYTGWNLAGLPIPTSDSKPARASARSRLTTAARSTQPGQRANLRQLQKRASGDVEKRRGVF